MNSSSQAILYGLQNIRSGASHDCLHMFMITSTRNIGKSRKKRWKGNKTIVKKKVLIIIIMYGRPATRSPRTPMIPTIRDVRDVRIRAKTYHQDHHHTYLRSCQFRRNQQGRQHLWGHAVADSKEHHRTQPYQQ